MPTVTLRILACAALAALSSLTMSSRAVLSQAPDGSPTFVYVGTYTGQKSKGVYLFKLQPGSGAAADPTFVPLGVAAETPSPSYLAVDPARRRLFAVNEVEELDGKPTGGVSAFSIDPATGALTLLNQRPSMGKGPCNLIVDRAGRNVLVANYGSGTVAVLPVGADGRLGEATSVVQHTGSSVNPQRQKGPHAHCITLDPANRFAFACDLGIDKILAYHFDTNAGTLTPHETAAVPAKPGAGPRHLVFRPDGRFAYVVNELHSTVTAYTYDAQTGTMKELQTISTLPAGFEGRNSGAEVAVHPSGRWLYSSNRGHDSVAIFSIDQARGTLTYVDTQSTGGRTPRHFAIDPSGERLVMANQQSDTLQATKIDQATGRLTPFGPLVSVPTPVFVKFVPPGR